jgi:hypothetical protein
MTATPRLQRYAFPGDKAAFQSDDGGWVRYDEALQAIARAAVSASGTPAPQSLVMGTLTKINDIRNSIIGCQTVNWSEHIYPLVAALEEAGFEGAGYPASRANVGTMLERTLAAENEAAVFRTALEAITNPIAAMQRHAEAEGAKLDGMMANLLARDPEYLKEIARAALAATSTGETE